MFGKKFFLITLIFLFGVSFASLFFLNLGKIDYKITVNRTGEISILFNREVKILTNILVEPIFNYEIKKKGLWGSKEIIILPKDGLPKTDKIKIRFEYKKIFSENQTEFSEEILIPINNEISSVEIREINGFISSKPKVILHLSGASEKSYELKSLEYPSVLWLPKIGNKLIEFEPSDFLPAGINLTLSLFNEGEIIFEKKVTVSDSPRISDFTKKDFFIPGDIVEVYFNKPIKKEENPLNITALGQGEWISDTFFSFKLGDVKPDTRYLFELKNGASAKDGSSVIEADSFYINTPGEIEASIDYLEESSQIKIIFNQPVDKHDFEFKFLSVPKIGGEFSWDNQTVYFNMKNLTYETKYNISIPKGVESLFGLPNKKSFNLSFSTGLKPIKNNIPLIKTKYKKGQALSLVSSALSFYNINVNEDTVLQKMGQDVSSRNSGVWGDPRLVFVGDHNSSLGYGVHASVIARVITSLGKNATVVTSPSLNSIVKELKAGRLVIVFFAEGADYWQTKNGTKITAGKDLRPIILSGIYGEAEVKGFFFHDFEIGEKYKYISASALSNMLKMVPGVTDQVILVK